MHIAQYFKIALSLSLPYTEVHSVQFENRAPCSLRQHQLRVSRATLEQNGSLNRVSIASVLFTNCQKKFDGVIYWRTSSVNSPNCNYRQIVFENTSTSMHNKLQLYFLGAFFYFLFKHKACVIFQYCLNIDYYMCVCGIRR